MAGLKGVALFLLLGTAAAQDCAADGSSAAYTETISTAQGITKRAIVATGCPNHESFCTGKPAGAGAGGVVEAITWLLSDLRPGIPLDF